MPLRLAVFRRLGLNLMALQLPLLIDKTLSSLVLKDISCIIAPYTFNDFIKRPCFTGHFLDKG